MEIKIYCGTIEHNLKTYIVEWEPITKLVWVSDKKGHKKNYGNAKAENELSAIECAKEMLISAGI